MADRHQRLPVILRRRGRASIASSPSTRAPTAGRSDPAPGIDENASRSTSSRRAFRRLDPDRRTLLILHHVEERSVANIAELLEIPVGTAKWRLYAARRALARALEIERR